MATIGVDLTLNNAKAIKSINAFEKRAKESFNRIKKRGSSAFEKIGKGISKMGALVKRAIVPITLLGAALVKVGADFEKAMTSSLAIMGDVTDEMKKKMSDTARSVALTTKFSAKEAAESYFFLASAGLNAVQSIEALPTVAKFAQAGLFDMALATDLLTDAQSALGLTIKNDVIKNMINMKRVSDVLVKANTLANATVEQFSRALTTEAGAALKSFKIDVEEGVAVLAVFADQGVKAEKAGTSLSRILRLMTAAAVSNKEAYDELGISVFDSKGKIRNLADVVESLTNALAPMNDETRVAALNQLGFAAKVQGVILPLLGTSDAIRKYEEQLRSASGITEEIADKQMRNFWAQLGLLKDRLIETGLKIGDTLIPTLTSLVKDLNNTITSVEKLWSLFTALPRGVIDYFAELKRATEEADKGILNLKGDIEKTLTSQTSFDRAISGWNFFWLDVFNVTKFILKAIGGLIGAGIGQFVNTIGFLWNELEALGQLIIGVLTLDKGAIEQGLSFGRESFSNFLEQNKTDFEAFQNTVSEGWIQLMQQLGFTVDPDLQLKRIRKEIEGIGGEDEGGLKSNADQEAFEQWKTLQDEWVVAAEKYDIQRVESYFKMLNQQISAEKRASKAIVGMRMTVANAALGLLQTVAGENKAAAIAGIALQKGIAISQVIISTEVAAMAAKAWATIIGGPLAGEAAYAREKAFGAIAVGLIAATGIAEAASVLSGSGGGGGGGSTGFGAPTSVVDVTPEPEQELTIILNINGEQVAESLEKVSRLGRKINIELGS